MNTFGQGFKFGLVSGLYNNIFGGFGMPCFNSYMANPFCNYSFSPMFFTPTFSFNSFMPYASPLSSVSAFPFCSFTTYSNPVDTFNPSYSQNLNPYSLYSSNSYSNNFGSLTQQARTDFSLNSLPSIKASNIVSEPIVTLYPPEPPKNSSSDNTLVEKPGSKPKATSKTNIDYSIENLKAKWKKKKPNLNLSDEFYRKVVQISKNINCDPNDLMAVMHSESAGTFNPGEWNHAGSRAVGLIQFTDIAVKSLDPSGKLTLEVLEKMSAIEQLDYVEKYLQYAKCKVAKFDKSHTLTAGELYSIVYLPAVAKKEVLAQREYDPKGYYSKNKIFDSNGDGKITKSEMAGHVIAHRA